MARVNSAERTAEQPTEAKVAKKAGRDAGGLSAMQDWCDAHSGFWLDMGICIMLGIFMLIGAFILDAIW